MKKHSKAKLKRYLTVFVVVTCLMSYSFAMLTSHAISYSDAVASVDRLSSLPFSKVRLRNTVGGSSVLLSNVDFDPSGVDFGNALVLSAGSRLRLSLLFDSPIYFCLDYKYNISVTISYSGFGYFTDQLTYFTVLDSSDISLFSSVYSYPVPDGDTVTYNYVVDFSDDNLRDSVLSSASYDPDINSVSTSSFFIVFRSGDSDAEYTISPSLQVQSVSVTRESAELKSNFIFELWRHASGMIIDTINIIASQPMLVALICALPMVGVGIGLFRRVKNA